MLLLLGEATPPAHFGFWLLVLEINDGQGCSGAVCILVSYGERGHNLF